MITREDIENDDVVALLIGKNIYLGQLARDKAKEHGTVDGIIKRTIFKFMAELDLDPRWQNYANTPTLFTITEYNNWIKDQSSENNTKSPL
jgi:hypothetical protein